MLEKTHSKPTSKVFWPVSEHFADTLRSLPNVFINYNFKTGINHFHFQYL
jgi:hypothetical protein